MSREEYREKAAECLRLAQATNDPATKVLLLEMAQTWVKLAVKAQNDEVDSGDCNKS